jgi:hypothetical protein
MINPYTSPSNSGILFYITSAGKLASYFGSSTAFSVNTTISLNTWSHVILTRVSGTNYIYLNGNLELTSTFGGSFNITGNTNASIGRDLSYNNSPWIGKIGIVKAYNIGFSSSNVNQNFNALRGRYGI